MVSAPRPLTVSVHADQIEAVDEVCGATLGCTQSDLLGQLLLLAVTGVAAIVVLAAVYRVSEARSAVAEERSRTSAEQHAFARFAREVARQTPSQAPFQLAPADGDVAAVSVGGGPSTDEGLERVRAAYAETVLSMGHYDEEYGEPLAYHMGQEFGEAVATAVAEGDRLTPELKSVLLERARQAARDRERLMTRLDKEVESIEAAEEELAAAETALEDAADRPLDDLPFPRLADEWNRLGELESRLSRLLTRRQESLHERPVAGPRDRHHSLNDYLYGSLETSFPVLADGTVLLERVKRTRSRVLDALTSRA